MVDLDPRSLLGEAGKLALRFGDEAYFAALCLRSGLVGIELPHRTASMLLSFERFGLLGGAVSIAATKHGDRVALIDERGPLSYKQLDKRSNALANAWRERGLEPGQGVAILARNHRGFLDAVFAAAKCGARIILLNTDFAGPQIREVAGREGTDLLVYDDEYAGMLDGVDPPLGRWRAWTESSASGTSIDTESSASGTSIDTDGPAQDTLEALIEGGDTGTPRRPGRAAKVVILTSGTTGTPKGAPRQEPKSLGAIGGLLDKVPFRAREVTECCAPLFHALGFVHALLAVAMGSTLVLRRKFDPAATLASLERSRATAVIVVPVMLQRLLDLPDDGPAKHDLSALRIIFVAGAQLGIKLCERATEGFGPVLYNLYGSTEVAFATIATPKDLAAEPGCVGGVVRGAVVKIFDEHGEELPSGSTGRIFVGNSAQFEGYTGGGSKEQVKGLMSSGDVGHFDAAGRLFIDGRDDEMIVSGGENVFPREIEELLARHEAIKEASTIGVPDEKFGQRLRAFVVLRDGAALSGDEVRRYVAENLARFKSPREVVFLDVLPRNPTGKVLKRELAELPVD
ncbi:MAG: fatty-acyl-CoA synthase [Pseudonocardiales bacterium]|jgi:fatty-acyl-CoA synthase|nr:fatty-acyl-CoA synthase [Pseudonocardiales bacterium]